MTTYRIITTVDAADVKTTQRWYEEWKYNAKTEEYYIIEETGGLVMTPEGFARTPHRRATGLSEAEAMQWLKNLRDEADNEWFNPEMGGAELWADGRLLCYDLCETRAMNEERAIECGYLLD